MSKQLELSKEQRDAMLALKNTPGWKILLDIYEKICKQLDDEIALPCWTDEQRSKAEFLKGHRHALQSVLLGPDRILNAAESVIQMFRIQEARNGPPPDEGVGLPDAD